ncbi:hypothetical protein ACWJV3_16175, partial [Clostridioides difficile]
KEMSKGFESMPESMITQSSVSYVRSEYEKIGNFINNLLVEKIQEESNIVYNLLNSYVLPHIYKKARGLMFKTYHMLIYIKEKYYYVNIY